MILYNLDLFLIHCFLMTIDVYVYIMGNLSSAKIKVYSIDNQVMNTTENEKEKAKKKKLQVNHAIRLKI